MAESIYFNKKKVLINKVNSEQIQFRKEISRLIEDNWKLLLERRNNLFNSKLLRVVNTVENDENMIIDCVADVHYKEVVGIRYSSGKEPRKIDSKDTFKVLSVYLFILTADDKLIFVERDCGDWDKALDLPGGFIQDKFDINDLEDFAIKRATEDLSIKSEHIDTVESLGLFNYEEILELMAIYKVKLTLTLDKLIDLSTVKIYELPNGYSTQYHDLYFRLRLHSPCSCMLKFFLKKVL